MYQAYSRFWDTGGAAMLYNSREHCACRYSHRYHTDRYLHRSMGNRVERDRRGLWWHKSFLLERGQKITKQTKWMNKTVSHRVLRRNQNSDVTDGDRWGTGWALNLDRVTKRGDIWTKAWMIRTSLPWKLKSWVYQAEGIACAKVLRWEQF